MEKSVKESTKPSANLQESRVILDCSFENDEFAEDYEHFDPKVSNISLRSTVRQTTTGEDDCMEILRQLQPKQSNELAKSVLRATLDFYPFLLFYFLDSNKKGYLVK